MSSEKADWYDLEIKNRRACGSIVVLSLIHISMEQMSLPNENCNSSGEIIDGVWYYVYDLDLATDL